MDTTSLVLAVREQGFCPLCKQALVAGAKYEPDSPREWIKWFTASKNMPHKHHFSQAHGLRLPAAAAPRTASFPKRFSAGPTAGR